MASSTKSRGMEHHQMGLREYREGKYVEAISSFDKAITLGYKTFAVYDCKAAAMAKLDDWRKSADRHADMMIVKFQNDKLAYKAYYRKADILRLMGHHSAAMKVITDANRFFDRIPVSERPKHVQLMSTLRERIEAEHAAAKMLRLKEMKLSEEELRAKRQKMVKSTTNYAQLLPRDILVMICEIGLMDDDMFGVKMSRVSPAWREAIHSQQGLWGTLSLGIKGSIPKAHFWMDKSRGRIVRLIFKPNFDLAREEAIGGILKPAFHGIQVLETHCALRTLRNWKGKFSSLKRLVAPSSVTHYVDARGRSEVWVPHLDFDLCRVSTPTPAIEHIEISNRKISTLMSKATYQSSTFDDSSAEHPNKILVERHSQLLSNLRTLRLDNSQICVQELHRSDLLQHCPKIREFQMTRCILFATPNDSAYFWTRPRDQGQERPKLILEDLRKYSETSLPSDLNEVIFDNYLSAPNLRELSLESMGGSIIHQLLAPGLTEALPKLTSLDIGRTAIHDAKALVGTVLPKLTNLRFLNVSYCGVDDYFLQAISHHDGLDPSDQLLPNLTALSIAASDSITTVAVRDFINSRLPLEERFVSRKGKEKVVTKTSGAFKPTAPRSNSSGSSSSSVASRARGMNRAQSQTRGGLGDLFAPGIVISQPSSLSAKSSETQRRTAAPQKAPSQSSLPDAETIASAPATPIIVDEPIVPFTQSFFSTQMQPVRRPRPRISWLNIDHCERLDADLIPMLESKVAFVSGWLGTPVEARIRGMGRWRWDKEVVECEDDPCQLVPVRGKRGCFQVHHYCHRGKAQASASAEEQQKEPGWKKVQAKE